ADGAGRVPAVRVMVEIDAERDLAFGFEAGDIRGDEVTAACASLLRQREERGQDRRRGMAAERVVAVVEIERVRRGAVDERGIEHAQALAAAERQRRPWRRGEGLCNDLRRSVAAAGERHADGVEYADLGPVDGLGRQVFVARGADA